MKSYGLEMEGLFKGQPVSSVPEWTPNDKGRLIYDLDSNRYFFGTESNWIKLEQPFLIDFSLPYNNIVGNRFLERNGVPSNLNPFVSPRECYITDLIMKTTFDSTFDIIFLINSEIIETFNIVDEFKKSFASEIILHKDDELACLISAKIKINNIFISLVAISN